MKEVIPRVIKPEIIEYEASEGNMTRSIAVYYSGGVMSKKKYRKVYRDSTYKRDLEIKKTLRISVAHLPYPRLVPYHKLTSYVKSIPMGTVYNVYDTLCEGMREDDKVSGCYRDLKYALIMLGKYYLSNNTEYDLVWFNNEPYTFVVSLGGDGAPFGKYDTACSWLISFLNIGRVILSCNENYLILEQIVTKPAFQYKGMLQCLFNNFFD